MIRDFLLALAPALVTCGAAFIILPWLSPRVNAARGLAMSISAALLLNYMWWRISASLPPAGFTLDFIAGLAFLVIEVASMTAVLLLMFVLSRSKSRSEEVEGNKAWLASAPPPLVDVFICTYNEERGILERTIIGAMAMDYANFRVWVLDDGRRPWLRDLTQELGCEYLTRGDNLHAKAGNINNALRHVATLERKPDFVSILDADFVPRPAFLSRALCLFRDPQTAVVQTPQHFINPDPIQNNLSAAHAWPDEQRFFFDVVLESKDAWGTAFCCGTSSVIRFAALQEIGGFPTESVTEDYLLTLRLKERGHRTVYLNEPLTIGLAPEGVKEYITQRSRWCLGLMQIVRGGSGPFSRSSRLPFLDRLGLIDSFLCWTAVYYARAAGLIVPVLYLLFGIRCVDATLTDMLSYFMPYFVWQSLVMQWVSRGRSLVIMNEATQLVAMPAVVRAGLAGLLRPKGHKFEVTAKGGERDQRFIEWSLVKIFAAILALNVAGLALTAIASAGKGPAPEDTLAFGWSWFNTVVLTIVCFVCVEKPRRRKAERFAADGRLTLDFAGSSQSFQLADISITGARFEGLAPAGVGSQGFCHLRGERVLCSIERNLGDSFAVQFDESLPARVQAVRHFYERDYVRPFEQVEPVGVGRAVLKRLFE